MDHWSAPSAVLALAYLVLMVAFGDAISRPFLPSHSRLQRIATAFLVGLLVSTWLTYLSALAFAGADRPLVPGNGVAVTIMAVAVGLGLLYRRHLPARPLPERRSELIDLAFLAPVALLVTWMMVKSLGYSDGFLSMSFAATGDFGATTAIAQSFGAAHNLPPEYPHFAGPPMLYHFLYYFQVGNLTFLGLDPAAANNVLSVPSVLATLVLVMAFGHLLFGSRTVGRIAMLFFLAHGSLSLVPWLASLPSLLDAPAAIWQSERFLTSPFPYRGEDFGLWSLNVYNTQRHLISGIGVLLVALLFVVDRLLLTKTDADVSGSPRTMRAPATRFRRSLPSHRDAVAALRRPSTAGYLFSGLLLGLLPLWNSATYVSAAAIMAAIFLLFPNRMQMLVLAIAAAVPSIPQVLSVRPEGVPATTGLPRLQWGYVVNDPNILNVLVFIGFIFGLKLLLSAVSLAGGSPVHRRLFLAITTTAALAFVVQFTIDMLLNHKFLNLWLLLVNVWAAAGVVALWKSGSTHHAVRRGAARTTAVVVVALVSLGGLIDVMPIKNDRTVPFAMSGDPLYEWVQRETDPNDTFLSQMYVTHPILFAGRRLYYGFPGFTWAAGYDVDTRERVYREMLQSRSPRAVVQLLQQNDIAYVAVDDSLRQGVFDIVTDVNEDVLAAHLEQVFEDVENRYEHLAIYRVPTDPNAWQGLPGPAAGNAFTGGVGSDPGRFADPRGVGVGADGSIVVADTGNDRVQRFAPDGTFVAALGEPGSGDGQLDEPSGVAVDAEGHVFVADAVNDRVQEFDAENRFVRAWTGPELAFYGPRDVAIGNDGALYVLDQGRARVVREAPDRAVTAFGTLGSGPDQLDDPTGLGAGGGFVFVADPRNARIQVWDGGGAFVRSEPVPEWEAGVPADVAVDADEGVVYASAPGAEVLVFDIEGGRLPPVTAPEGDAPAGSGSLAVAPDGHLVAVDVGGNRLVRIPGVSR